jgi:hypothetical protein
VAAGSSAGRLLLMGLGLAAAAAAAGRGVLLPGRQLQLLLPLPQTRAAACHHQFPQHTRKHPIPQSHNYRSNNAPPITSPVHHNQAGQASSRQSQLSVSQQSVQASTVQFLSVQHLSSQHCCRQTLSTISYMMKTCCWATHLCKGASLAGPCRAA